MAEHKETVPKSGRSFGMVGNWTIATALTIIAGLSALFLSFVWTPFKYYSDTQLIVSNLERDISESRTENEHLKTIISSLEIELADTQAKLAIGSIPTLESVRNTNLSVESDRVYLTIEPNYEYWERSNISEMTKRFISIVCAHPNESIPRDQRKLFGSAWFPYGTSKIKMQLSAQLREISCSAEPIGGIYCFSAVNENREPTSTANPFSGASVGLAFGRIPCPGLKSGFRQGSRYKVVDTDQLTFKGEAT